MSTTTNFVTKLKEIVFIAAVRDDGGNTPGHIRRSTETSTMLTLSVVLPVVVLVCLLTGGVIIYKSKGIFLTTF